MQKVISALALLAVFCFSPAEVPWGQGGSTPVQVFRQATDVVTPQAPAKSASVVKPVTKANVVPAKPASLAVVPVDPSLQEQINQLNQNSLLFSQSVDRKIEDLNRSILILQGRIQQLSQALLLMNQEVMQHSRVVAATEATPRWITRFSHYSVFDYSFWIGVVVLLLVLMRLVRHWKAAPSVTVPPQPVSPDKKDLEGDYDYLGSRESIPAKLNLARAYVAMGNYAEAQTVLAEVLASGDNKQCLEAEALLKKIPAAETSQE